MQEDNRTLRLTATETSAFLFLSFGQYLEMLHLTLRIIRSVSVAASRTGYIWYICPPPPSPVSEVPTRGRGDFNAEQSPYPERRTIPTGSLRRLSRYSNLLCHF